MDSGSRTGPSAGTDWQVEGLHYLDGYRLVVDGRVLFEGVLPEGEPFVFPIFEGEAAASDALVLFVDGGDFARSVSIDAGRRWEGRWTPGSTANGAKARMWVIEAPGSGVGSLLGAEGRAPPRVPRLAVLAASA